MTAFVGLAVAIILLFGVPRGVVVAHLVKSERQDLLERSADVAAYVVADAVEEGEPVTPELLAGVPREDERVEFRPAGGSAVVAPAGSDEAADGDLTAERTIPAGGSVTVSYPRDAVRADVVRALWPMVVLAIVLVALAGLAGWLLARRLARPFVELAGVAEVLGRGHLDTDVPRYGMPEADAIGRALEDSSRTLRRMLRRQREVNDYASHDLRTPLTGLRLTLEDLSLWPATPPEVAEELCRIVGEVDRFSRAVSALVDTPGPGEPPELVDVAGLVRQALREHQGSPPSTDVLPDEGDDPVLARLPKVAARRALDLMLEQADAGAGRESDVRVLDGNGYVTVELDLAADAHAGPTRSAVWDQAVGLAAEIGGRLAGTRRPDGSETWSLILPKEATSTGPG